MYIDDRTVIADCLFFIHDIWLLVCVTQYNSIFPPYHRYFTGQTLSNSFRTH